MDTIIMEIAEVSPLDLLACEVLQDDSRFFILNIKLEHYILCF